MLLQWGFATTSNKQRIQAFVGRGVRLCLYSNCNPTATQLAEEADKSLFKRITYNEDHICSSSFQMSTVTATVFELDVTTSS